MPLSTAWLYYINIYTLGSYYTVIIYYQLKKRFINNQLKVSTCNTWFWEPQSWFAFLCFQVTSESSLPYDSMHQANCSVVTEFVLLGLTQSLGMQFFLFLFFSLFYVGIILGNLFIVFTVIFNSHLHSPMYILLANLSLIDMGLSSTTIPRMISDLFSDCKSISFHNCMI